MTTLLFGASAVASASCAAAGVSVKLKWMDQVVADDDVCLVRMQGGKIQTLSTKSDKEGNASFKDVAPGIWAVRSGPAARAQQSMSARALLDLRFQQV